MQIGGYRRISGVLLAAALGMLPLAISSPALAAKPAGPTFNPNLLLQGSTNAGEPSIRTDRFGHAFVIGPTGVPAGCKAFRVAHNGASAAYIGQPDHTAGGGDCDYSFGPPNVYSQQVGGDDRMWMAADPKLNSLGLADIFMTYHDVSVLDIEMGVSVDGGFSYVQNAPIINNNDVPVAQWQGGGANANGARNELGNVVARRTASGLTLYSIFQTPDSAIDNLNQGIAATSNFNRVYEAIGTVTRDTAPPVISWRNYEIYHGPLGARYNRIFPVTAVDAVGRVYAFWSDGNHIDYKADTTGTGWKPGQAPSQITNPGTVNTAIMPWAQAGADGIVDVVFYGASGGAGAQPRPQDDVNNIWNTYFAQSTNRGSSFTVTTASDHAIHKRPDLHRWAGLQSEQSESRSDAARLLPGFDRPDQRRSRHCLCR